MATPTPTLNAAQEAIDNYFSRTPNPPQNVASSKINSFYPQTLVQPVNDKYDFSVNKNDQEITTNDVYQRDLNTALDQQNALYIVGTITCATLLITAILIAK
jgi:DNA-directed RNA polymerase specialized sigma54-like protein